MKKNHPLFLSCFLILMLPCQVSFSQQTLSDTINLYPVTIISIHPKANQAESLHLDYQDNMAHDGGALLNQVAAIGSIRKSGGYGFDPVFRGFKYDQLNLVLNGAQTASAACPNRMDPPTSQMSPNMIQKVEILKGPFALRYGNAFGATINFISPKPAFSENKEGFGRLSGRFDSNGNIFRTEGLAGIRSKHIDLGLYAAWSEGQDYRSGDDHIIKAGFMRSSLGASLGIKIGENQHVKLSATRNLARDTDFTALPMDLRRDDTWMLSASHEIYPKEVNLKSWHTTLYGSLVDHLMDNLLKPLNPRMVNAVTSANTLNFGGRTEGSWRYDRSRFYAGLDFRHESARGQRTREFLMGPNAGNEFTDNVWQGGVIQRAGVYTEYHIQGSTFKWVLAGRLNLNLAELKDPDPSFENLYPEIRSEQLNPAFSLGISRSLNEQISLGLWLGRIQRSGGLSERYINYFPIGVDPYEMLGNPLLNPEVNNEVDFTAQWKSHNSTIKLDLFAAYLQDFISSVIDSSLSPRMPSSPGVRCFTNIHKAFKTGVEASWSQALPAGVQLQISMAYTYAQDLERSEPLSEIAPLDVRLHLSGNYLKNRLLPYITFRHVLEQARISEEFGETVTPSFSLADLGVSFSITKWLQISGGIQNVFDTLYYEHLSRSVKGSNPFPIYSPGRCYFVSFSLDWM
jgi:iron complex outermembrane receptor protein